MANNRSFAEVFHELRRERGLTYRELAAHTRQADPQGKGLSPGYMAALAKGDEVPTKRVIETLALALDVEPQAFIEWRLAMVRSHFDEQAAGLEQAATNLCDLASMLRAVSASEQTDLYRARRPFSRADEPTGR